MSVTFAIVASPWKTTTEYDDVVATEMARFYRMKKDATFWAQWVYHYEARQCLRDLNATTLTPTFDRFAAIVNAEDVSRRLADEVLA